MIVNHHEIPSGRHLPHRHCCYESTAGMRRLFHPCRKVRRHVHESTCTQASQASCAESRCYNTETRAKVAIKNMDKKKRLDFDHLLDNEVDALLCTNFYEVPRVTRFIDQGMSASGDRCLIFEYGFHPVPI